MVGATRRPDKSQLCAEKGSRTLTPQMRYRLLRPARLPFRHLGKTISYFTIFVRLGGIEPSSMIPKIIALSVKLQALNLRYMKISTEISIYQCSIQDEPTLIVLEYCYNYNLYGRFYPNY